MMASPLQTHDADLEGSDESQRQYVRVRLPLSFEMDGTTWRTQDWSVGGFSISSYPMQPDLGDRLAGRMFFDFAGFGLSIKIEAEVRHCVMEDTPDGAPQTYRIGFGFVDATPQQLAVFRFLMDSYLGGEIVQVGDLMAVASRSGLGDTAAAARVPRRSIARILGKGLANFALSALILLATGIAANFALSAFYQDNFVVESASAQLVAETLEVVAPTDGTVAFIGRQPGEPVTPGEPLIGVRGADGAVQFANGPCDCVVVRQLLPEGAEALALTPLLILMPADGTITAAAQLPGATAGQIMAGDAVRLDLPEMAAPLKGRVLAVADEASDAFANVTITVDSGLPISQIDSPVQVVFDVGQSGWVSRILTALNGFGAGYQPHTAIP